MDGGEWPQWNASSDRIYFVQGLDVMEVELSNNPALQLSRPTKLFTLQNHKFDGGQLGGTPLFAVTGDGERFIVPRVDPSAQQETRGIVVVQNWVAEFENP